MCFKEKKIWLYHLSLSYHAKQGKTGQEEGKYQEVQWNLSDLPQESQAREAAHWSAARVVLTTAEVEEFHLKEWPIIRDYHAKKSSWRRGKPATVVNSTSLHLNR